MCNFGPNHWLDQRPLIHHNYFFPPNNIWNKECSVLMTLVQNLYKYIYMRVHVHTHTDTHTHINSEYIYIFWMRAIKSEHYIYICCLKSIWQQISQLYAICTIKIKKEFVSVWHSLNKCFSISPIICLSISYSVLPVIFPPLHPQLPRSDINQKSYGISRLVASWHFWHGLLCKHVYVTYLSTITHTLLY